MRRPWNAGMLAVLVLSVCSSLFAQSADWRVLLQGGVAGVFPAGDLYSGRPSTLGWCADLRIHRIRGLSGVGGLFGGASIHGVSFDGDRVLFLTLEGGGAIPVDEIGSHAYLLGGFDIYIEHIKEMKGSMYTLEKAPAAGFRLQTGVAFLFQKGVGVDIDAAADLVSMRFEDENSYAPSDEVRISTLFTVGARLYFELADF